MEVCVKGLNYKFAQNDIYQMAVQYAAEFIADMYYGNAEESLEEAKDMIENGDVSDITEYQEETGDEYLTETDGEISIIPFNANEFKREILEKANTYLRNYYDLPDEVIFDVPQDIKETPVSLLQISNYVKNTYGVEVESFKDTSEAQRKDTFSVKSYQGLKDMIESNDYATLLKLRANLRRYSVSNISLIYAQKPNAIDVKGYNAFIDIGRKVKSGEHALGIWCPNSYNDQYLKTKEQVDKYIEKSFKNFSSSIREKERQKLMDEIADKGIAKVKGGIFGYRVGLVFDITQTETVLTSEKAVDAWIERNVDGDQSAKDAKKDEMMKELKSAPKTKIGKKFVPALRPDHDSIDGVLDLERPLNKNMENFKEIQSAIDKTFGKYAAFVSYDGKSEQDRLYNAISDYAEYRFSKDPSGILGIKSPRAETGLVHSVEVLVATSIICETIGVDCSKQINLELAEMFDKKNFSGFKEAFTEGRIGTFQKGFNRATKLVDEFTKDFEKNLNLTSEKKKVKDRNGLTK